MGQILVRAIPDDVLAEFKKRAKEEGSNAEAVVRRLIIERTWEPPRMSLEEALKRSDELRAMTPKGPAIDTTALIREARDCGYDGSDL